MSHTETLDLIRKVRGAETPADVSTTAFGGQECCTEYATHVVTRTDATGSRAHTVCGHHLNECTGNLAEYVYGWGDVTMTVRRIR